MIDIPESVKGALKKNRSRKNFIAHFTNGERADITNENVIKNAVKFTESLCSKQYLKFGLTEASEIDFETMGVENIVGREIECAYDVYSHEIVGNEDVYTKEGSVPLGRFTVKSCPRNHENMTRRKVTAYSSNKIELSDFTKWFLGLRQTQNEIKFDVQNMLAVNVNMDGFSDMYTAQSIGNTTSGTPSLFGTKGNNSYYMGGVQVRGTGGTYRYESINAAKMNLNDGNLYKIRLTKGADYDSFVSMLDNLRNDGVVFEGEHTYRPYMQGVISHYDNGYNDFWLDFGKDYYIYVPNGSNFVVQLEAFYKGAYNVKVFYGSAAYSWYSSDIFTLIGEYEIISDVQITRYDTSMPAIECVIKSTGSYVDSNVTYHTFTDAVDFTKLFNGWLELNALFGKQQRDGSYALKHLSKDNPIEIGMDLIERLWWDEYDVNPIGSVKYSFKSGSEQQIAVYQFGAGKSEYDMTGNYVLLNMDNASMTNINALLDQLFIPNIGDIGFTPVDLTMKGLPYIEAGDFLQIILKDDTEVMESSLRYDNIIGYAAEFELPSTELRVYESKIQQVKVDGAIVTDYSVYAESYAEDSFTLIIAPTGYTSGTVTLLYGEREVVETYVMQRSLSGIQSLTDDIESSGGEIIESEVIEDES